jgi:hypothetical protein
MTGIEVVDSAVKIGLGASIAGLASYFTTRTSLKRAANAEYTKRRRDLLEKVINLLIDFDKIYRHQKALYDSFCISTSECERGALREEFVALDEQLRVAFEKFADASGFLSIIGETAADRALDEYWDAANRWYETDLPTGEGADPTLELLRESVVSKRDTLMKQLATAYKMA